MARYVTNGAASLNDFSEKTTDYLDQQIIKDMLDQINIVQILEDVYGLTFEKRSEGKYRGHCPFPDHRDSDPSFDVDEERGYFKCWGCGRKGNLLTFLLQVEGLGFKEALGRLSVLSGIDIGSIDSTTHRALYNIDAMVKDYLNRFADNDLPAGMSLEQFLLSMAQRLRAYETKVDHDSDEIKWVDLVYKHLDALDDKQDYKGMSKMWDRLGKRMRERLAEYKEK